MSQVCLQATSLIAIPVIYGISVLFNQKGNIQVTLFHRIAAGQVCQIIAVILFLSVPGNIIFMLISHLMKQQNDFEKYRSGTIKLSDDWVDREHCTVPGTLQWLYEFPLEAGIDTSKLKHKQFKSFHELSKQCYIGVFRHVESEFALYTLCSFCSSNGFWLLFSLNKAWGFLTAFLVKATVFV